MRAAEPATTLDAMRTLLLPLLLAAGTAAAPLEAQQANDWRSRWRIGVGAASPATWLENEDGLEVSSGIAPALSAELRIPRTRGWEYLVGVRGSWASTTVSAATEWDGDAIYVVDLMAGGGRQVSPLVHVRGGVVGAFVGGGGDLAPFDEATRFAPGVEGGVAMRLGQRLPFSLGLGAQALRYGGSGSTPTGSTAGMVLRLLVELRHGR